MVDGGMTRKPRKPATNAHEQGQRAKAAYREYNELHESFETVRFGFLEAIAKTKLGDVQAREALYLSVQVLDAVHDLMLAAKAGAEMVDYQNKIQEALRH